MDTILTVLSDVVVLITFPLHCRYLYVMSRADSKMANLEYAFRASIVNIVVANLLYSFVFLLIQEPAAYGQFTDFYKLNSWWLGKVVIMQSVPLILLTAMIHFLIAVNRVSALVDPTGHKKGSYYDLISPFHSSGVSLVVKGDLPNIIYQGIAVAIGGLFEVITILLYVFIGLRVRRLRKLPKSHITTTVSAVLISTGGFVIIVVILPHLLWVRLTGQSIWSTEMFYAVFKFANAYNNAVTPWVMLMQYRNIRRLVLGKSGEIPAQGRGASKTSNQELKKRSTL